jgi:hypothetical protein
MDFHEQYTSYTDAQILAVLKNHKDYQVEAVEAAVSIGVERKLINSEQDLLLPEFQHVKSVGNKFIPEISSTYQRQKLSGSIFRFLYVMSFLPVVFGFLKYAEGQLYSTVIGIGLGLLWFLLSFLLNKTQKIVLFIPLFLLLFSIVVAVSAKILVAVPFRFMDMVMLIIGTLLPVYLLFILKKMMQTKPEPE